LKNLYALLLSVFLLGSLQAFSAVRPEGEPDVASHVDGQTSLAIFPNPVKTEATISFSADVERISVMNIVGREVLTVEVQSGTNFLKIDLSELQPGVYFLSAQSQGKNLLTKRFMKEL